MRNSGEWQSISCLREPYKHVSFSDVAHRSYAERHVYIHIVSCMAFPSSSSCNTCVDICMSTRPARPTALCLANASRSGLRIDGFLNKCLRGKQESVRRHSVDPMNTACRNDPMIRGSAIISCCLLLQPSEPWRGRPGTSQPVKSRAIIDYTGLHRGGVQQMSRYKRRSAENNFSGYCTSPCRG